jgi:predicted permease
MHPFFRRLWYFARQRQADAELAEELEFHQEMRRRALETRGDAADTSAAARRALGNIGLAREQAHDVWIWPWFQDAAKDIRFAARLLTRDRWFTIVAVLALGLGIGVNTTQFTIVNAICLRGLPIARPDRVGYLGTRDASARDQGVSFRDFVDLRSATRTFGGMAAFSGGPVALGDDELAPERVLGTFISDDGFSIAGERPTLGRDFADEDDRPGATPVVILSHGLWVRRYGGDPATIGRTVRVGGVPAVVIGIMPQGFKFPNNADLWQPLTSAPGLESQGRNARTLGAFGRLADGATMEQAHSEAATVFERLARDHPETNTGIRPTLEPINERFNGRITDPAWIAFTIVGGLVVLISCANVANLLLMRSARRSREVALRASLGATRQRIVRQLIVESMLLAFLGGLVGLGLSILGIRLFASALPENGLPYWVTLTMDGRVLGVLMIVCLGTVLVFGLAPALHASTTDVSATLKDGGRTGGSVRVRRWTAAFLVLEFALTVLIVANVVSGVRAGRAAERADVVFDTTNLLTMWVTPPGQTYGTAERHGLYERVRERLVALPGVSTLALTSALPLGGASTQRLMIDGREPPAGGAAPTVWTVAVDARYFDVLGLALRRGRPFDDADGLPGRESAIVNERFVAMHFGDVDPIGRRIRVAPVGGTDETPWLTIVGVSPSVRQRALPQPDPVVYLPWRQAPALTAALMVRTSIGPGAIAQAVREAVRGLDPDLPVYRLFTMEEVLREAGWNGRLSGRMITTIASIALLLSAVGLYGVTAYAVSHRTHEIGVRMALGAGRTHIAWLVLRRVLGQIGVGLAAGVVCTWVWGRLLESEGPAGFPGLTDPATIALVTAVFAGVGLVASLSPVWRAMRLSPVAVLRHE